MDTFSIGFATYLFCIVHVTFSTYFECDSWTYSVVSLTLWLVISVLMAKQSRHLDQEVLTIENVHEIIYRMNIRMNIRINIQRMLQARDKRSQRPYGSVCSR